MLQRVQSTEVGKCKSTNVNWEKGLRITPMTRLDVGVTGSPVYFLGPDYLFKVFVPTILF